MRQLNINENQTSERSNDSLSKILVGLRKIKILANKNEDRYELMKIREKEDMDMFRTFVHVFLIHSKRKMDQRYEKYQTRIGKLFTIFDEALVILLMMNSWSCYEEKSQISYESPQKKDMVNSLRGIYSHQVVQQIQQQKAVHHL